MTRSSRSGALTMLLAMGLTLLSAPASAAPAGVEGRVHLRNLTLPAGGGTVEESLVPLLFADEAGWAGDVTLTIDASEARVAEVTIDSSGSDATCSTGSVVRCVLPGPHRVYQRPEGSGGYGYITTGGVFLSLTPKPGASVGDSGGLSVVTKVDEGPAITETSAIRIGEGVDLTAVDDRPRTVAPGGAVSLRPRVRNTGRTAVDGLTAVISAVPGALADTNFGNCTYGFFIACTFDTTLTVGATYGMTAPFTVRVPGDAAAASETPMAVQWLTAAEWQDWQNDDGELPEDRPGTGPELRLEQVAVAAAGAPQADIDHDDNGSYTTVSVSGRRTDLVAIGATVPGTAGERTISVGLVNRGPGTLRYPPFPNNLGSVSVSLPVPMSVVAADERCTSPFDDYDPPPSTAPEIGWEVFTCPLEPTALRPGQRVLFTFKVRVARAASDEEGSVRVSLYDDEPGVDRDPRNNDAPIKVTGTGRTPELPITGTVAATVTATGLLLLLLGATVLAVIRRRAPR